MLRLPDDWVWDFWHVAHERTHHLFYLHARRSLDDPDLRHWHATIGHATSADLVSWTVHDDVLGPAPRPAWDDYTTWTGSVVAADGTWHLFYTGTSHAEQGLVQRVGHATSVDLTVWKRVGDGLAFELDPGWYESLDTTTWHDQAWRDPVIVRHAGTWNALVTARLRTGPATQRGTIGTATSDDLVSWTVRPPLSGPTPFGQLEIPDVIQVAGRWFLLFATAPGQLETPPEVEPADVGTWAVRSTGGPLGPWAWDDAHVVLADGWYGGKLIVRGGELVALAWRQREADGSFAGWISDPMPARLAGGRVVVEP